MWAGSRTSTQALWHLQTANLWVRLDHGEYCLEDEVLAERDEALSAQVRRQRQRPLSAPRATGAPHQNRQ